MTTLGDRMKAYEQSYETAIIGRLPVVVRIDGKGFSKWTKRVGAVKPFDDGLAKCMARTVEGVMNHVEGALFGYTQSDEATFVIRNDQSLESTPWFGNRIQKMTSIIASAATATFNHFAASTFNSPPLALFDARVFAVPDIQEAINCLVWRQNDATKNSISAACYYKVAEITGKKTARNMMHGLNQNQQQELLFSEANINWNDFPTKFKRGIGVYKKTYNLIIDGNECTRSSLFIDTELPTFTQDRGFLEEILSVERDQ